MRTRLTLRLDDRLIRRAKAYARKSGKSLSELVADFFDRLQGSTKTEPGQLSGPVESLAGSLAGKKIDRKDYRAHLRDRCGDTNGT